jgi:hypothetical protein
MGLLPQLLPDPSSKHPQPGWVSMCLGRKGPGGKIPCQVISSGNRTAAPWVTKEVTERGVSLRAESELVSLRRMVLQQLIRTLLDLLAQLDRVQDSRNAASRLCRAAWLSWPEAGSR